MDATQRIPVVELERYGLSLKVINRLENCGAIYVDQLSDVTFDAFSGLCFGDKHWRELAIAMRNYDCNRVVKTVSQCIGVDMCQEKVKQQLLAFQMRSRGRLPTTKE